MSNLAPTWVDPSWPTFVVRDGRIPGWRHRPALTEVPGLIGPDENTLAKQRVFENLRLPTGCAVSSVVEHHLDTVGVRGSKPLPRTIPLLLSLFSIALFPFNNSPMQAPVRGVGENGNPADALMHATGLLGGMSSGDVGGYFKAKGRGWSTPLCTTPGNSVLDCVPG